MWRPLLLLALTAVGATAAAEDPRPLTIGEFMTVASPTGVIAHRGFSGAAPENTLAAIELAIQAGAHMIEVDVAMTADGHVVCLHDETLDRTTSGSGLPSAFALDAIKRLDAGSWFSAKFAGEPVPTLAEVFAATKNRILVNVEIKPEAVERGAASAVAALVDEHGMEDRVVVSSFAPEALLQINKSASRIVTASLFNSHTRDLPDFVRGERVTLSRAPTNGKPMHLGRVDEISHFCAKRFCVYATFRVERSRDRGDDALNTFHVHLLSFDACRKMDIRPTNYTLFIRWIGTILPRAKDLVLP